MLVRPEVHHQGLAGLLLPAQPGPAQPGPQHRAGLLHRIVHCEPAQPRAPASPGSPSPRRREHGGGFGGRPPERGICRAVHGLVVLPDAEGIRIAEQDPGPVDAEAPSGTDDSVGASLIRPEIADPVRPRTSSPSIGEAGTGRRRSCGMSPTGEIPPWVFC